MTSRSPQPIPALLALSMLAACGPNDVALGAFQYGSNLGGMAMDSLHDANDEEETIDPEAIRAKSRAAVHRACPDRRRLRQPDGPDREEHRAALPPAGSRPRGRGERRQQLQEALNPVNAAIGIARGAAGHAGARGLAGDLANP